MLINQVFPLLSEAILYPLGEFGIHGGVGSIDELDDGNLAIGI